MNQPIYKILRNTEWQIASSVKDYTGSADDIRDGFIHFSTAKQLNSTLEKYFRGQEGVYILAFEAKSFKNEALKWEPSRGGALFPHLYGTLDVRNAQRSWQINVPSAASIDLSFLKET